MVEAARLGLAVHGSDLNPAATALVRIYELINLGKGDRAGALSRLRQRLGDAIWC